MKLITIIGPSGAGKDTIALMLSAILGMMCSVLIPPDLCVKVKWTEKSIILSRNAMFQKAKCSPTPDTEIMSIGRRRSR